jgi:hypothetical protein
MSEITTGRFVADLGELQAVADVVEGAGQAADAVARVGRRAAG